MSRKSTSPPGSRVPERHCLVTGGAGFVGSHLCELLVARGDRVTVLDDLSTGCRENLAGLAGRPGFELVIGSVRDPDCLRPLVRRATAVFHLAAAVGVRTIVEKPLDSLLTNIEGTQNVLAAAADAGGRPVLITSSSEVYGKNENIPFAEDNDLVIGATTIRRWGYACSKALDEFLAFAYAAEQGVPAVVTRLFNTIGPRQTGRYGMVVPRFVGQALAGEPLTVFGDGRQTRCFTYVADVAAALAVLIGHPAAVGGVFNIGTRDEISIIDLARKVKRACNSASPIRLVAPEDAYGPGFEDMRRRVPDLERIERLIGYRPRVSLDEALARIIAAAGSGRS